jgi:hypothetical protein
LKNLVIICAIFTAVISFKAEAASNAVRSTTNSAMDALKQGRGDIFVQLLAGRAKQMYSTQQSQQLLLNRFGNFKKVTFGDQHLLSDKMIGDTEISLFSMDIFKDDINIFTTIYQCSTRAYLTTHTVCTTPEPIYNHDHGNYGGGRHNHGGGYDGGSYGRNDDSGFITPGLTHEVPSGSSSDDGHKPGNQDPDRPGRFADSLFLFNDQYCHEETQTSYDDACLITDMM